MRYHCFICPVVRSLLIAGALLLCSVAAAADDDVWLDIEPLVWVADDFPGSDDFSALSLRVDPLEEAYVGRDSLWTDLAIAGRRIQSDELRLDWTPLTDQQQSRKNRVADFKPSTGLGVDFDARAEAVVLEWRFGF